MYGARKILKVWERKEIKDNYQAVQTDKNERLHGFFLHILADNNLKRN